MRSARAGMGWGTLDCFRVHGEYSDRDAFGGLRFLRLAGDVTKIGIGAPLQIANGALCPQARTDIYSDTLNYTLSASLRSPTLFGARLNPTATLYSDRLSEYNAYVRDVPIGTSLSISKRLSSLLTLIPLYQLELGRTTAQPALYCAVFNLCTPADIAPLQEMLPLAVIGVILVQDLRDNPIDPHAGSLISVEGNIGSRFLGSAPQLQFDKGTVDAATYLGMPGGAVLAGRVRLGAVVAQGAASDVPQQERLYAGGPTTVRGFVQNQLGPLIYIPNDIQTVILANGDTVKRALPDSGERPVPAGGNWSVVINLEYRSQRYLNGLLQWAMFTDAGQVWNGTITGIHGLYWTPGLGVRAYTPIGPIRVDVAYNAYLRPYGEAYYNAPVGSVPGQPNEVPLYCVSPGNTIPVVGGIQLPGYKCPATYVPRQPTGLFRQLTLNISIGQAF